MGEIKNLHLLADTVKPGDIDKMEIAALQHRRHANITFKFLEASKENVVIQVTQAKSAAGNYFPRNRLADIVTETFGRFFKDRKIFARPMPFQEPEPDKVDHKWIEAKMLNTGTRLKDIASETGLDYSQLSSLVSGNRPLSQPMKALFYYYFRTKEAVKG